MIPFSQAAELFRAKHGHEPAAFGYAPGRLNLIGEHTDYVGGSTLPVSLDRGVTVAAAVTRTGSSSSLYSDRFPEHDLLYFRSADGQPPFVRLATALAREYSVETFDAVVLSDLPDCGGLGSSSAFCVALSGALLGLDSSVCTAEEICYRCQRAEKSALGVKAGLMDQYASIHGDKNVALLLNAGSLTHRRVELNLPCAQLVIIDSGQPRTLAISGYSTRRRELESAIAMVTPAPVCLGELTAQQADTASMPAELRRRLAHAMSEEQRVIRFVEEMSSGNLPAMGSLLRASHLSLSKDFEVSTAEIDLLVDLLDLNEHVYGARIMGGGFGGTVLALASDGLDSGELQKILDQFRRRTGFAARRITAGSGPGAQLWSPRIMPEPRRLSDWSRP